jgi:hypothetical protein
MSSLHSNIIPASDCGRVRVMSSAGFNYEPQPGGYVAGDVVVLSSGRGKWYVVRLLSVLRYGVHARCAVLAVIRGHGGADKARKAATVARLAGWDCIEAGPEQLAGVGVCNA